VPPPTGNGEVWGAAAVAGTSGSVDLAAFGYVEEEFIVSGHANIYRYGPSGAVEVQTADVPYATRILVRRPLDPRKFSGNVQVETTHPNQGINVLWQQSWEYLLARGDAYVSITTRRTTGGFSAIEIMKSFDPVRYAPLNFPEDGLNWDMIGQVGQLLKTPIPANPLNGYDVEHLYAVGWSGGGALLLLYISDGFHARARMPDGSPIFDGYLVGEPSGYPRINSAMPAIPTSDPRQKVLPRDVPAISLDTRPQELYRRRADGDQPNDRYRVYEVAGASHADLRLTPGVFPPAAQFEHTFLGGGTFACAHEITQFPMHHLFKSTLARLDAWAARGVTPPPSQRIALNPDGTPMLDQFGNALGGVRTTYTDVATARYFPNEPAPGGSCDPTFGAQERFSAEQLTSLYSNHGGYVSRVAHRVQELEQDGWLLPADAHAVRQDAAQFDGI
jgi:Alpha/beta hydrolase domain